MVYCDFFISGFFGARSMWQLANDQGTWRPSARINHVTSLWGYLLGCFYLLATLTLQYIQLDTVKNLKTSYSITKEFTIDYLSQNDHYLDLYKSKLGLSVERMLDTPQERCSWLIVESLERCTDSQRNVLEASYGREKGRWSLRKLI